MAARRDGAHPPQGEERLENAGEAARGESAGPAEICEAPHESEEGGDLHHPENPLVRGAAGRVSEPLRRHKRGAAHGRGRLRVEGQQHEKAEGSRARPGRGSAAAADHQKKR